MTEVLATPMASGVPNLRLLRQERFFQGNRGQRGKAARCGCTAAHNRTPERGRHRNLSLSLDRLAASAPPTNVRAPPAAPPG